MVDCLLPQLRQPKENIFLIDWITVVFKSKTVMDVQSFLCLSVSEWTTEKKFRNGYPMTTEFSNISIWWGADQEQFYDSFVKKDGTYSLAADKVRDNMGVCLNMSGQGCRSFEEFSSKSWYEFFCDLQVLLASGECNITRLDLAYDDHVGLLPLWKIHNDVKDRNFRGPAKKTRIIWSDDLEEDLQGLTIEIGSNKSEIMIRIYNKAAERGYDKYKHWVRVEIQLRQKRACSAVQCLGSSLSCDVDVGHCASGILRNYCMFVVPTNDSNKSRWPVADYWERILQDIERIRLWKAPGEPYNFSRSEAHLIDQYHQFLYTEMLIHGSLSDLELACLREMNGKSLKPKYRRAVDNARADAFHRANERIRLQSDFDSALADWKSVDPFAVDQSVFDDLFRDQPFTDNE